MAQGIFILSVRLPGNDSFGVLENGKTSQDFRYDDNSREKRNRRDATLERAKDRAAGWQRNYKTYADATFRIEEVDADGEIKVVWGTPYERRNDHIVVRTELTAIAHNASKRMKRDAVTLSDYLFVEADRTIPTQTAWRALGLEERIELVRQVAAGMCTPVLAS